MLHPLEHVRNHQNPLADTPALASCQAPQLGRPRFAAEEVCWHRPSPKHGTLAYQLYHIWGSLEAGINQWAEASALAFHKSHARTRTPALVAVALAASSSFRKTTWPWPSCSASASSRALTSV